VYSDDPSLINRQDNNQKYKNESKVIAADIMIAVLLTVCDHLRAQFTHPR
jgi:hypothetical protein